MSRVQIQSIVINQTKILKKRPIHSTNPMRLENEGVKNYKASV